MSCWGMWAAEIERDLGEEKARLCECCQVWLEMPPFGKGGHRWDLDGSE